jgi:peroxiredoxin Q/BCP
MTGAIAVGDKAPAFKLPKEGDEKVTLASLKGKKVVLYFYPKDDTSGCTKEAIAFTSLKKKFEAAGATILGVSPDSVESHAKFSKKYDLDLTLLSDETKEMLEAYGVWTEKSMYGRKYMGVERTTVLIDEKGKIARIWNKVKVDGHAEEVLAAVQAM